MEIVGETLIVGKRENVKRQETTEKHQETETSGNIGKRRETEIVERLLKDC
jgi:hypothetical protein